MITQPVSELVPVTETDPLNGLVNALVVDVVAALLHKYESAPEAVNTGIFAPLQTEAEAGEILTVGLLEAIIQGMVTKRSSQLKYML